MGTINKLILNGVEYDIGGSGTGLTDDLKSALDQVGQNLVYMDDDSVDVYEALHSALYPPNNLVSISAVYTQSGTVYDTASLDSLKTDLVVTAHYSDSTTATITSYTLSGTLTAGTSTITVSYGGKTTTFNVTVTEYVRTLLKNWDLTESLIDTVDGTEMTVNENAVRSSSGLTLNQGGCAYFLRVYDNNQPIKNTDIEVDISAMVKNWGSTSHGRLISIRQDSSATKYGDWGFFYEKSDQSWQFYMSGWSDDTIETSPTAFSGKTLVLHFDDEGIATAIVDGEVIATATNPPSAARAYMRLGDTDQCAYTTVITGVRVYSVS